MKLYSKYLKQKSCAIFLFHGVINKNPFKLRNYTKKHLSIREFEDVLNDLKTNKGKCISLDNVYLTLKKNLHFEDFSYCITFDDGFYNNFKYAFKILKKRKLYATFYLTSDFIEKNEMSWIDKIEHMIEKTKKKIEIKIFGKKYKIKDKRKKIDFLKFIRHYAKNNRNTDFNELVKEIKNQLNYKNKITNLHNILDKKMNWQQVKKINSVKYFTIGAHTSSHKILSFLNYNESKFEITNSIKILRKKLKEKIRHFSYPEGLKNTFNQREIKILKKSGIIMSPSAEFGINKKGDNLFSLKRILVS